VYRAGHPLHLLGADPHVHGFTTRVTYELVFGIEDLYDFVFACNVIAQLGNSLCLLKHSLPQYHNKLFLGLPRSRMLSYNPVTFGDTFVQNLDFEL
jgi:hypothetical protein